MPLKLKEIMEISAVSLSHCLTHSMFSCYQLWRVPIFVGQMSSKNVNGVSPHCKQHCKQHLCTFPDDGHMLRY